MNKVLDFRPCVCEEYMDLNENFNRFNNYRSIQFRLEAESNEEFHFLDDFLK